MRISDVGGSGGGTSAATTPTATTVSAGHDTVFSGSVSSFPSGPPGWNSPDPSAYAWTLPNTSHWYNVGQNISQGVFSFVANTLLELIAWILHIAIYVCSYFSDPSNLTDKAVKATAGIFRSAYQDIFVKFLPVLIMFFVAYLAWKYVVAHHAKMLQGIASVLLATGLVAFFCFDFGPAFNTVDSFGQLVTNTAASAVASTAGTNVGSEYDTLWQNYVLFPWEDGQFGGFSGTYSDFNVSSAVCSDPNVNCSFTNDAGQKTSISGGNWVNLFLANTSSGARTSLENALTQAAQDGHSPFTGSALSAQNVTNANPYGMIPFLVIELILILVPVFFLIYVGFQLFVRELLFIVTIMMGIVTVPMAFIPEIGWRITFNWLREAVGHQVERLGNAIYAALLFMVASLITQGVTHSEFGMMEAFLVDAILFAAALIYRQKIFSIAVNPLSDSVRGVDQHQRMTMDEYIQHQSDNDERKARGLRTIGTDGSFGHLSEHFDHGHESEHHNHAAAIAESMHRSEETKSSMARNPFGHWEGEAGIKGRLASMTGGAIERAGASLSDHWTDIRNPGRPLSHAERVRIREARFRGMERRIHGKALDVLHTTHVKPVAAVGRMGLKHGKAVIRSVPRFKQSFVEHRDRFAQMTGEQYTRLSEVFNGSDSQPYSGVQRSNETMADFVNRTTGVNDARAQMDNLERSKMEEQYDRDWHLAEQAYYTRGGASVRDEANVTPMQAQIDSVTGAMNAGYGQWGEKREYGRGVDSVFAQMDQPGFQPMSRDQVVQMQRQQARGVGQERNGYAPSMSSGFNAAQPSEGQSVPIQTHRDESNVPSQPTNIPSRQNMNPADRVMFGIDPAPAQSRVQQTDTNVVSQPPASQPRIDESDTRSRQDEPVVINVPRQEFVNHANADVRIRDVDHPVADLAQERASHRAEQRSEIQAQQSSRGNGNRADRRSERNRTGGTRRAVKRGTRGDGIEQPEARIVNDPDEPSL